MDTNSIKDTIQGIIDGLAPLAQKMGVAIEGLWGWAIKHNYALAIENAFVSLFGIVAIVFAVVMFKKGMKVAEKNTSDWRRPQDNWYGGGIALCVVGIMILVGFGTVAINRTIAPEWNTAKDISCLIKNCGN